MIGPKLQELLDQVLTVVAPHAVVIPSEMDECNVELSPTGTCGSVPQYSSLKLNESIEWFPPISEILLHSEMFQIH